MQTIPALCRACDKYREEASWGLCCLRESLVSSFCELGAVLTVPLWKLRRPGTCLSSRPSHLLWRWAQGNSLICQIFPQKAFRIGSSTQTQWYRHPGPALGDVPNSVAKKKKKLFKAGVTRYPPPSPTPPCRWPCQKKIRECLTGLLTLPGVSPGCTAWEMNSTVTSWSVKQTFYNGLTWLSEELFSFPSLGQ